MFSPYGDNDSKRTFPLTEFVDEGIIIGNFLELSRERLGFDKAFRKFWQGTADKNENRLLYSMKKRSKIGNGGGENSERWADLQLDNFIVKRQI